MTPTINPFTKTDIIQELGASFNEITNFIQQIPEEEFTKTRGDKWSIAENLSHLIKGNQAIASGLKLPKLTFRGFGKPNRPVRAYQEVVDRYLEKLKLAQIDPNPFAPKSESSFLREEMLEHWMTIDEKMRNRIEKKWEEKDLDNYLMPHPLMGKLMAREMLFFTIFHNHHHLKAMKDRYEGN